MRGYRLIPVALLAGFLLSITVGVSLGVEEKGDFLLRDYKSGFNKSFKDILTSDLNVLVLTETTCYSCIKELKAVEALRAKHKDRVSVTAIFLDREGWPRVKKYLDFYQFDLDYSLVDSGQTIPERFKTNYVPTMLIFDRQGVEMFRKRGFTDGEETVITTAVEDILFPPKAGQVASPGSPTPPPDAAGNAPMVKSSGCASS